LFYETNIPQSERSQKQLCVQVVLTPAESRRLIAKATVALPEVQYAYKNGMIIIARGITSAYISEELFGIKVDSKAHQTVGIVCNGITDANSNPPPCTWHVTRQGKVVENADSNKEILSFGPNDVFIKGANAIDHEGTAGICSSSVKGGTIGMAWPIVTPRDAHLIIPVGLEKMIPSVMEAAKHSGIYRFKYSTGLPVKIVPVQTGKVVTEIQAFAILAGVRAYMLASGGVGGSEGAVVLALEGDEERVIKAFDVVKSIKEEPPIAPPSKSCVSSAANFQYDALAQLATLKGI
jgi:hypothetical protein